MTQKKRQETRLGTIPIKYRPSRDKWELTIYADGKRARTLHDTEEAASKAWSRHNARLKRFGTDSGNVSPADLRELEEARRIIPGVDLRDAATFYRLHHPEGMESATVSDAVAAYLDHQSRKSLSKRYSDALRLHCESFARDHPGRSIRSITGNDVLDWLASLRLDARTVRNYSGSLSAFFAWSKRRGMIATSPAESIHDADLPRPKPKPKGVLTVDQCAALMDYLAAHYPRYVPWHALQLFAGIRRAEAGRMTWEMIDLERRAITLEGWSGENRIVKTGDDWVLHDLPANLWTWLDAFQWQGRVRIPGNETLERIRRDELPKVGIPAWPQNALRHTFCTMLMSLHGNADKVATWSRHTNAGQLFKSYVARLVSREEAERFTAIQPRQAPSSPTPPIQTRDAGPA